MNRDIEEAIHALAARQQGLVTRAQLLELGLSVHRVRNRVRRRQLHPVHRSVYRVGPLAGPHFLEMAAVLGSGKGALISHRSAASLWQLLPHPGASTPVDVSTPLQHRVRRSGIRPHRAPNLEAAHVTTIDGIPVTSPARTMVDLAGVVGVRDLEQAVAKADRLDLTRASELLALIAEQPRRRGVRVLRALLESATEPALTRSEAEMRFLKLVRKAGLPLPVTNVPFAGYELDFLWRSEGVVVEVDGYAFHSSPNRFEADRRRDAELSAKGLRIMRVTWQQIVGKPEAVLVRLAQTLALAAAGPRAVHSR